MYQSHFGLREAPFGITPNPDFFYAGNARGDILQALLYAVCHGEGIIKVSGEVGAGKTMLCRMLERQLPPQIDVIYLINPNLDPQAVQYAIAAELGIEGNGLRIDQVQRQLQADLIARHSQGRQVVLLVEEAQAMPLETLEAIRLLTNLETAHSKLLQIVLFGQPELDAQLALPSMRQLKERITHSFTVPALAPARMAEFLDWRLRAAGYQGPALFSPAATKLIGAHSEGIVRRINILADKAMLAAYAEDANTVELRHARQAVREAAFRRSKHSSTRWPFGLRRALRIGLLASLLMLLILAIWRALLAAASNL